jgi:hypothetical protein
MSHKLQSLIHYRTLLPRHHFLPEKGKSVIYVSGTICHPCVGSLMHNVQEIRRDLPFDW